MARRFFAAPLSLALLGALLAGCASGMVVTGGVPAKGFAAGGGPGSAPTDAVYLPRPSAEGAPAVGNSAAGLVASDAYAPEKGQGQSGLKGGELDDNAQFGRYLDYLASYQAPDVRRMEVSNRFVVRVVDAAGKSVPDASLTVLAGTSPVATLKSGSDGRALVFAPAGAATGDLAVQVRKGEMALESTLADRSATLALPGSRGAVPQTLDIAFVLDVTGSMGDELARIQQTTGDISARIKSLPAGSLAVRYGLVAYRDRNDDFVTRTHDFTQDLPAFKERLAALAAVGGGDYPEAVQEALHAAINKLSWTETDSVRLMFVVGDAPPHLDYAQDFPYPEQLRKAAAAGIKIFPIAASGLDNQGEYVFRQFAQYTGGKFLYITYGGDTPHHVGPVQENNLDDLVVGIVKTELANLE
ncbi:MAG: VWA domain-containing protein [Candidatus Sericytochromatia bacterium]|nr:VWA domain-containing protein [Candidatus Tanganyikabacteria bacterium]